MIRLINQKFGNLKLKIFLDSESCTEDLDIGSFQECQFSASTALSSDTGPYMARTGSNGGKDFIYYYND